MYWGDLDPSFDFPSLAAKFDGKATVQLQCFKRCFVAKQSGLRILCACAELNSKTYRHLRVSSNVTQEAIALDRLWNVV